MDTIHCSKSLQGENSILTTKLPEILGTHLINLRRKKGWVNLRAT